MNFVKIGHLIVRVSEIKYIEIGNLYIDVAYSNDKVYRFKGIPEVIDEIFVSVSNELLK